MRDRLIELRRQAMKHARNASSDIERDIIFADFLLENGVIVPPCKVGDTVYFKSEYTNRILSNEVENIRIQSEGITVHTVANNHLWGDEIFLTREEAEAALRKEGEGK